MLGEIALPSLVGSSHEDRAVSFHYKQKVDKMSCAYSCDVK